MESDLEAQRSGDEQPLAGEEVLEASQDEPQNVQWTDTGKREREEESQTRETARGMRRRHERSVCPEHLV